MYGYKYIHPISDSPCNWAVYFGKKEEPNKDKVEREIGKERDERKVFIKRGKIDQN